MPVDSIAIDFNSNLSFDLPSLGLNKNTAQVNKRVRNRQCMPSDDEDEEEEVEDGEEEEDEDYYKKPSYPTVATNKPSKPVRKSCPLPSDSEEEEEDRGHEELNEGVMLHAYMQEDDDDDNRALLPFVEGTHLQQLYYKQQQHQAQLAQFHHRSRKTMSGMDLLKQLEREKQDAKRQKPKLDTSRVKIKGLLGNLPEPGSHNISFQQLQQQQQRQMNPRTYLEPMVAQHGSRSPSPNRMHYRK